MVNGAIYLCFPSYGNPHPAAAKQFWARSMNPEGPYRNLPRIQDDRGSSLLANGFNAHWCAALNIQRMGSPCRYFGMLHNDVVPMDWWMDQLLSDLEASGADLMTACLPIKDIRGLTSTAIDDPANEWEVLRRLTLEEVHRLPEVFGAADCGYPNNLLLANTGCWVCRFDRPWRYQVHFEIRDRIDFLTEDGRWLSREEAIADPTIQGGFAARGISEDWNFSRQLGRQGGKVMATRRVQLRHVGEMSYPNSEPWGEFKEDENTASKWRQNSLFKKTSLCRPFLPSEKYPDVDGWLSDLEGRALARLADGKRVLEIGSYCGRSTLWLASTAQHVCAVDTFDGRGIEGAQQRSTLSTLLGNLSRYGLRQKVQWRMGESETVLPGLYERFDLCFVDGAHDEASVVRDVELCLGVLRHEGLLVCHDYRSEVDPGVSVAVDQLVSDGARLVEVVGSLAVIRPAEHQYRTGARQAALAGKE